MAKDAGQEYVILPGGNPLASFEAAALTICQRAMPYMARYNLLQGDNAHTQSIAAGMSAILGRTVTPEHIIVASGAKHALNLSMSAITDFENTLRLAAQRKGVKVPQFFALSRKPNYQPLHDMLGETWDVASYSTHSRGFSHDYYCRQLKRVIRDLQPFGFATSYFDVNPANPTGLVRTESETRDIADILEGTIQRTFDYAASLIGEKEAEKIKPFAVVDDHVYWGLEHGDRVAFSFGQLGGAWNDRVHAIFGASKYGLVGMRSGLVVAPLAHMKAMEKTFDYDNSDVSPFSVLAAEYMFGTNPDDRCEAQTEITRQRDHYRTATRIAAAFIDGDKKRPLSDAERVTAHAWLGEAGMPHDAIEKTLKKGLRGLKIAVMPDAGFFLTLDVKDWMRRLDDTYIAEGRDLDLGAYQRFGRLQRYGLDTHGLYIGTTQYLCEFANAALVRFTVAVEPKELATRLMGLKAMADDIHAAPSTRNDKILKIDLRDWDMDADRDRFLQMVPTDRIVPEGTALEQVVVDLRAVPEKPVLRLNPAFFGELKR